MKTLEKPMKTNETFKKPLKNQKKQKTMDYESLWQYRKDFWNPLVFLVFFVF